MPAGCVSDESLVFLAEGRLSADERIRLLSHADSCDSCRELLAGVGRAAAEGSVSGGEAEAEESTLVRGASVGRYIITDFVAAGAMGEVHAAYDPELHRRVALKFLRTGRAPAEGQRLAREAQAMARLSHPNVVPVFDAGTWGERFFIAMELVEGQTLRAWLAASARPWRRVLAAFLDAGRGLAAAHAVGLVHRDFKPDNVLVGSDGRARVADFGLAHAGELDEGPALSGEAPTLDLTLTHHGGFVGTPAYAAPEVLAGGEASPASDLFSFSAALYEGLYGVRPFILDGKGVLDPATRRGVQPAPRGTRVPAWVRRVVTRGLSPSPGARWPSMAALLDALARDPSRAWQRAGLAATVFLAAGSVIFLTRSRAGGPPPCEGSSAPAAAIWNAGSKARAQQAFEASGASYAGRTFASFAGAVDAWTERWSRARAESCRATRVERTQSEELLDRRTACLDGQLDDLRAIAEVAAQPAPKLVDRAHELARGLPSVDRCDARAVLESRVLAPPDETTRSKADELRVGLSRGDALIRAGRYDEALTLLEGLAREAHTLGYAPVEGQALHLLGWALDNRRRVDESVATLLRAQRTASAAGDDDTALQALVHLVFVVGSHQDKPEEAWALARDAEVLGARMGERAELANLRYYEGIVRYQAGDPRAARDLFERSLAEVRRLRGPDDPYVGFALDSLGRVAEALEDYEGARKYHEDALALLGRTIGLDHPRSSAAQNNLGNVLVTDIRDYEGALRSFEGSLRGNRSYGEDNPEKGVLLCNMALAWYRLGQHDKALESARRGVAILDKSFGPEHQNTAIAHEAVGDVAAEMERWDEALDHYGRALAVWQKQHGNDSVEAAQDALVIAHVEARAGRPVDLAAEHAALDVFLGHVKPDGPRAAFGRALLCRTLVELGRWVEAREACDAAVAGADKGLPASHPDRALALWGAGDVRRGVGRPADAVPLLEQALAILEPRTGDVVLAADIRFSLARALVDSGGDAARARGLAQKAREALVASIGEKTRRVQVIDRWSAGH